MTVYKYRAKKGPDEILEGTVDAQTEKEAIDKISHLGYLPVNLEEQGQVVEAVVSVNKYKIKVRSRDITIFSRQLASLLRSGVPILDALNIISRQTESGNLKIILHQIHDSVKDGTNFSYSLSQYNKVFSSLYIAMIRAGEDTGKLPEVLLRISEHQGKQEEMLSRLRMALAYPLLMLFVGIGTVIFMLTFVMPRLTGLFINMGQELPMPTRILISLSNNLRSGGFWIIAALVFVFAIIKRQLNTKPGRFAFSVFKLHLPFFGNFILKAELARFSRTLELLLKNGISILKAIDVAIPVLDNEVLKDHLRQCYMELEHGGSLGNSLKKSNIFPMFMSNLIGVGEASGNLDDALGEVASAYERDTDETMRTLSSLLEPVMILVMGLIVGFVVMAMLLPIFEINVMSR